MATRVIVQLPGKPDYAVRIGSGILSELGHDLREIESLAKRTDVLLITDANVGPLYQGPVQASLTQAGFAVSNVEVPAGETTKSIEVAAEIWSALAQLSFGRDCFVVALGGGVVGDLAGFVASTYMRGVPVVQVPTTLLAMVDSSVGGKTAVNLPEGKNLVGTFFQPSFVCADVDTLDTLPEREWRCGCGEVAKSAVIDSDDFFFWLCDHAQALARRETAATVEAIKRCVVFKADVVARDETESAGVRECLNFGHTLGHAIETTAGFGTFSHGAAVAEGMRFACDLAREINPDVSSELADALGKLLDDLGLPVLPWRGNPEELLSAMKHDKKNRKGEVRFVLVNDVGQWEVCALPDSTLKAQLERWSAAVPNKHSSSEADR